MPSFLFNLIFSVFLVYGNDLSFPVPIQGYDYIQKKFIDMKSDKPFQLFFFLNKECPCSHSHITHLFELQKKYPQVEFTGFHSNKNVKKDETQKYFDSFQGSAPVIDDTDLRYATLFKALKTPHVFLYNSEGKLLYEGAVSDSHAFEKANKFYLVDALKEVTQGKEPSLKKAKIIGCFIQR